MSEVSEDLSGTDRHREIDVWEKAKGKMGNCGGWGQEKEEDLQQSQIFIESGAAWNCHHILVLNLINCDCFSTLSIGNAWRKWHAEHSHVSPTNVVAFFSGINCMMSTRLLLSSNGTSTGSLWKMLQSLYYFVCHFFSSNLNLNSCAWHFGLALPCHSLSTLWWNLKTSYIWYLDGPVLSAPSLSSSCTYLLSDCKSCWVKLLGTSGLNLFSLAGY